MEMEKTFDGMQNQENSIRKMHKSDKINEKITPKNNFFIILCRCLCFSYQQI